MIGEIIYNDEDILMLKEVCVAVEQCAEDYSLSDKDHITRITKKLREFIGRMEVQ